MKNRIKRFVFASFFASFVAQLSTQWHYYLWNLSGLYANSFAVQHHPEDMVPKVERTTSLDPQNDKTRALLAHQRDLERDVSSTDRTMAIKGAKAGDKNNETNNDSATKVNTASLSRNVGKVVLQRGNETDLEAQADIAGNKELIASLLQRGIYKDLKELLGRSDRFPSIDKRARLYLSTWYIPPCTDDQRIAYNFVHRPDNKHPDDQRLMLVRELPRSPRENETPRTFVVSQRPRYNRLVHGDPATMRKCGECHHYVPDAIEHLLPAWDRSAAKNRTRYEKPLLFSWGDMVKTKAYTDLSLNARKYQSAPHVPIIMKFRNATRWTGNDDVPYWMTADKDSCSSEPHIPPPVAVVAMMKSKRHYRPIADIPKFDRPWKEKKNAAVWRGSVRGVLNDFKESELHKQTPLQRCMLLPRCRLVYNTAESALIDAGMVGSFHEGLVQNDINGKQMYKETMDKRELLQYKAIIMLEGNDVSTGLKWALFSNSVVMMPEPTRTSWAMEELLEPWVHYIPLADDLDDVEEKMQWVIDHDEEAEEIARRGSLWMTDMLYHPDSKRDEELIYEEIVSRFQSHFVLDPNLSLE